MRQIKRRSYSEENISPPLKKGVLEAAEGGVARRLSDDGRERGPATTDRYHEVDSSEMAFQDGGNRLAFREGAPRKLAPFYLEPIMSAEVARPRGVMLGTSQVICQFPAW